MWRLRRPRSPGSGARSNPLRASLPALFPRRFRSSPGTRCASASVSVRGERPRGSGTTRTRPGLLSDGAASGVSSWWFQERTCCAHRLASSTSRCSSFTGNALSRRARCRSVRCSCPARRMFRFFDFWSGWMLAPAAMRVGSEQSPTRSVRLRSRWLRRGCAGGCLPAERGRRARSTKRRQGGPDLPRRKVAATTVGRPFTTPDGKPRGRARCAP